MVRFKQSEARETEFRAVRHGSLGLFQRLKQKAARQDGGAGHAEAIAHRPIARHVFPFGFTS